MQRRNNKFFAGRYGKNYQTIRRSQIISTFGVGSIIDFPNESLMLCNIEKWSNKGRKIYEPRLQRKLNVKYFMAPPSDSDDECPEGIPAVLFPKWLFCKRCHRIRHIDKWTKLNERNGFSGVKYCDSCTGQKLNPARFILICPDGHIDDFDWEGWAHRNHGDCGKDKEITVTSTGYYSGLTGYVVKCKCGAKNSMAAAVHQKFNCRGYKPWSSTIEGCEAERAVVTHRGAGNVYFPNMVSSIDIPPFTDENLKKIRETSFFEVISTASGNLEDANRDFLLKEISKSTGIKIEEVREKVELLETEVKKQRDDIDYLFEEYMAFKGKVEKQHMISSDFHVDPQDNIKFGITEISQISLIKRLREIRVLTGFTRVIPNEERYEFEDSDETAEPVPVNSDSSTEWKPGIEVRGEGIFIEISKKNINEWLIKRDVSERLRELQSRVRMNERNLAEYILLHSVAHILIRQLSFECGYSSSSLKEKIYCSSRAGQQMSGILIYTAEGDSDGTLGGLVRLGEKDSFQKIFKDALASARWCSSDPLCIELTKQGFQSLNLAACHACLLLPETCCETRNLLLDRALLLGTPDKKEFGFFSNYL